MTSESGPTRAPLEPRLHGEKHRILSVALRLMRGALLSQHLPLGATDDR